MVINAANSRNIGRIRRRQFRDNLPEILIAILERTMFRTGLVMMALFILWECNHEIGWWIVMTFGWKDVVIIW